MLKLVDIAKSFQQPGGAVRVLTNLNLAIDAGQTAALLGESGSGKSTVLHLVAGLDRPDAGEIWLAGQPFAAASDSQWNAARRTQLGMVFQQYHLVPTLPVAANIRLQARLAGQEDAALREHLVARLGLQDLLDRLPHQLSGGQQQRVAIARALLHKPRLVLADEPTGNLDAGTSHTVMTLFTELLRDTGASLLMVTHSQDMAAYLDARWLLRDGAVTRVDAAS